MEFNKWCSIFRSVCLIDPNPISVTIWCQSPGLYSGETDRDLEWTQIFTINKDQQVNDGRLEADHMRLDNINFTDDEEVMLLPHRRDTDDPDNPGSDIHDGPDTSETQRDDWLLKTEPLQGARPRWNKGERPPVVDDRSGVLDLEAAGGVGGGGRNVEQNGIPVPLLPLERQILQEEEVTTPPRAGPSSSRASGATRRGTS